MSSEDREMEDELEELRQEKASEIEQNEEAREKQREQVKQKAAQHLTGEARSRLGNIRAAKPELASAIETQVARLGEMGQVDKVDDEQLKKILKELQGSTEDTNIRFRR